LNSNGILERTDALEAKSLLQPLTEDEQRELRKLWRKAPKTPEEEEQARKMRNARQRGRTYEKSKARQLGGRADGRVGKKDVVLGMFYIECKNIAKTPAFNTKVMAEASSHCTGKYSGQIPVALVRNSTTGEELVILKYTDFKDLHGKEK
jgi:hypothetical protein